MTALIPGGQRPKPLTPHRFQNEKLKEAPIELHTNSRLKKGKKGPPARGAAPKGLGGVEYAKSKPLRRPWRHLPFQGRQSTLDAIWYKCVMVACPGAGFRV